MLTPPKHRVDVIPVFIAPGDNAWDQELIRVEEAAHTKAILDADPDADLLKQISGHVLHSYWTGETRGDLAEVKRFLKLESEPTEFTCRRLPIGPWTAIKHLRDRCRFAEAKCEAIRHGLVSVTGLVFDPRALPRTDEQLDVVRELLGDKPFEMLAAFIWVASSRPTRAESFR